MHTSSLISEAHFLEAGSLFLEELRSLMTSPLWHELHCHMLQSSSHRWCWRLSARKPPRTCWTHRWSCWARLLGPHTHSAKLLQLISECFHVQIYTTPLFLSKETWLQSRAGWYIYCSMVEFFNILLNGILSYFSQNR